MKCSRRVKPPIIDGGLKTSCSMLREDYTPKGLPLFVQLVNLQIDRPATVMHYMEHTVVVLPFLPLLNFNSDVSYP